MRKRTNARESLDRAQMSLKVCPKFGVVGSTLVRNDGKLSRRLMSFAGFGVQVEPSGKVVSY